MRFLSKYLLIAFLLLGSWSSQADVKFVADPYLGWSFGSYNSKAFSSTGGKCTTFNGLNPGARLLVKYNDMFFLGPEFSYMPWGQYKINGVGTTQSGANMKFGLLVGAELQKLVRFWLGYNFVDRIQFAEGVFEPEYSALFKGSSMKLGVGYSPMPLLSVNLEYIRSSYCSTTRNYIASAGGNTVNKTLSDDSVFTGATYLLSVSAPIDLSWML